MLFSLLNVVSRQLNMSSNLEYLDETLSLLVCLDCVPTWTSFSSILLIVVTWIKSQVKSMFNFYFFLFGSVDYPWSYDYDEHLSTLSLSGIDFLCCCFSWTTIIFYSFVSMNTYSPCLRNCKMSNPIHYCRNCSNFLCFFYFLPFIRYPQNLFMQLSVDSIVFVCLLVE